jgi:lysophospholipase L1-like esterase
MRRILLGLIMLLVGMVDISAQENTIKWWDPVKEGYRLEGQGWAEGLEHPYDRFPAFAKNDLREVVWFKSQQSTGLLVKFRTDASSIHVRYKVKDVLAFEHMPATGVSGVDLYALDVLNQWHWTGSDYIFGDTVEYYFNHLSGDGSRLYHLYLPLYNRVEWMEIGVPAGATFTPVQGNTKGAIVVYGTSITQGGCASRPGTAWTAILGRKLGRPVFNFGFSSNGQLEQPVADLISGLDASVFILDCFPNMGHLSEDEIAKRLEQTVKIIRARHPEVPIVITEHADANFNQLNNALNDMFRNLNGIAERSFRKLKGQKIKNIYYLSSKVIGLNNESTVDGQHPTDGGMERYANAYENLISRLLKRK